MFQVQGNFPGHSDAKVFQEAKCGELLHLWADRRGICWYIYIRNRALSDAMYIEIEWYNYWIT